MPESVTVLLIRMKRGLWKFHSDPHGWVVLAGGRLVLAGLVTGIFGLGVLLLMAAGVVAVRDTTEMLYLFQVLVGGNLTLITIILSINQLVLSREFNTPGELHDQIQNVIAYRNRVEETTNSTTVPVTPADFLSTLLDGTQETAQRLRGITEKLDHDQLRDEVDVLVSDHTSHVDHIRYVLERSQGGIFNALAVTLETNYSHELNEAYRLQTVYENELSSEAHELFDELIQSLKQVDIARQYFKSIYMQSELARLSRILLYVGVPAVGSALLMLLVYASATEPPVGASYLRAVVPVVVILGFSPLAVLFAFILRAAVVAQRTVAITPFTTPTQETETGDR